MNVLNDTAAPSQIPTPKHRHSPRPGASCANIDLQGAWGGGLQFPLAILGSNTQWRARHERESIWVMLKSALYHGRHKLVKENCRDSWSSPRCWMPTLKRARQPIWRWSARLAWIASSRRRHTFYDSVVCSLLINSYLLQRHEKAAAQLKAD